MSYPPRSAFKWAAGLNQPTGSLTLVEEDLLPYTKPFQLHPNSQPVEPFPVRRLTLDGYERGDGEMSAMWEFAKLPLSALYYTFDTYLTSNGTLLDSAPMTFETLKRADDTYARYNGYLALPKLGDDYKIDGNAAVDVRFRFNGLEEI